MELELDDKARDLIGQAGFDPVYGARPLRRAIQQQIENPLAQRILRNEFGPGDRIRIAVRGCELVFEKRRGDIRGGLLIAHAASTRSPPRAKRPCSR